jgi:release factor glutamine methyltransferase
MEGSKPSTPVAATPASPGGDWTVQKLLNWTADYLRKRGFESAQLDAQVLLAHALGWKRIDLFVRYEESPPEEVRARFRELVKQRVEGCPVAYLVGRKEFFSLPFEVSPAVLIPRPESEFVVLECLRLARDLAEPRVLDVGTGSGNLAVTVAHQLRRARVTAVDVSPDALAVARRNSERHGVAERVGFLQGDLFGPLPPGEQFDFILSNPPYIAREDMARLPVGVRDYEPHAALDGGVGGYEVLDRLIREAREYLVPGGWLILEIGTPQEVPVRQRIEAHPGYRLGETILDGSRHPRVLRAQWQP